MNRILVLLTVVTAAGALFAGRPVARWDVVPYQAVKGVFKAGVVAYHEKGVKVEFIINKKSRLTVDEPVLNERTGVKEYVFPFAPAKFKDGLVNINARVTAEGEEPYDLPPLPLFANARGAFDPKKTIWVDAKTGNDFDTGEEGSPLKSLKQAVKKAGDGGLVYLRPGVYSLRMLGGGFDRRFWTRVEPAPGVPPHSVQITAGRPGTDKLHFKNLDFTCSIDGDYGAIVMGEGGKSMAWFENCTFRNLKGREGGKAVPFGNKLRAFVTGGSTRDMWQGPVCEILRRHKISSVSGTVFACDNCLVAECEVDDVDAGGFDDVPDLISCFSVPPKWCSDVICTGVRGTGLNCRAFSAQQLRDAAFVNVACEGLMSRGAVYSRFSEGLENVIFDKVSAKGQHWLWMTSKNGRGDLKPKDARLLRCEFGTMDGYAPTDGSAGLLVQDCTFEGEAK